MTQNNNNYAPAIHITPEIEKAFAPAVLDVIKSSLAPTATNEEFLLFAHKAASYGLDPFKNEIFFIKYGNQARIQFAAEAYLSKAREKEGFQPPQTQMVHDNDKFKVATNPETKQLEVTEHEIQFPRGAIIGAYCIAARDNFKDVTVIMDVAELAHMFTGSNKENWKKYTSDMFGKYVQQRALKKQYGLEFEDVTIKKDDTPQPPRDITPDLNTIDHKEKEVEPEKEDFSATELKTEINKCFARLGITTKEGVAEWLTAYAPEFDHATATPKELGTLLQLLKQSVEHQERQEEEADDAPL